MNSCIKDIENILGQTVLYKALLLTFSLWPKSILAAMAVFPLLLHAPNLIFVHFPTSLSRIRPSCPSPDCGQCTHLAFHLGHHNWWDTAGQEQYLPSWGTVTSPSVAASPSFSVPWCWAVSIAITRTKTSGHSLKVGEGTSSSQLTT